jgi:hypothetical protein
MASRSNGRLSSFFEVRIALSCFLLLALSTVCQAKNDCPWINEATAGGLLGSDAVGDFKAASQGQPAVCTFIAKDESATRTLTISVLTTPDFDAELQSAMRACGPDSAPILAIGNRASVCVQDNRKGGLGELVVGRVRDQVFTITLGSSLKGDILLTRQELKTRIYTAAEQVAGNLF